MKKYTFAIILGVVGAIAPLVSTSTDQYGNQVAGQPGLLDVVIGGTIWFGVGLAVTRIYIALRNRNRHQASQPEPVA
jgi:hypothetical protein